MNLIKNLIIPIIFIPAAAVAEANLCLNIGKIKSDCTISSPQSVYEKISKITSIKKDQFTNEDDHEKIIEDKLQDLWVKIESDEYLFFDIKFEDKFLYNSKEQRWESRYGEKINLLEKFTSKKVIFSSGDLKIMGRSSTFRTLSIRDFEKFYIPMKSNDARKLSTTGRLLISAKRKNINKLENSLKKVEPTISDPNEILSYEFKLPHDIELMLISDGKKIIFGYDYNEKIELKFGDLQFNPENISNEIERIKKQNIKIMIEDFLKKIQVRQIDDNNNNAVHLSIWENKLFLLEYVPDTHRHLFYEENKFGFTPVTMATDNPKAIEKLKSIGVIK